MCREYFRGSHKAEVETGTEATPGRSPVLSPVPSCIPAAPSLAGGVEGLGGSPLCVSPTTQVLVTRSLCLAPFTPRYIQD